MTRPWSETVNFSRSVIAVPRFMSMISARVENAPGFAYESPVTNVVVVP